MSRKKQKRETIPEGELLLPGGKRLKVGPDAVPSSGGNASMSEIIRMFKKIAGKGIIPPPPDLYT